MDFLMFYQNYFVAAQNRTSNTSLCLCMNDVEKNVRKKIYHFNPSLAIEKYCSMLP